MSSKDMTPEKVHSSEQSAFDAISVTWVVRQGDISVSSLPLNEIKAVWRNEIGDAEYTPGQVLT